MYSYDRSVAASAISAIVPDPSLQRVCICKSPRRFIGHARFLTSSCLASASEMKSWRMAGGLLFFWGGLSSQRLICRSMKGQLREVRSAIGSALQPQLPLPATEKRREQLAETRVRECHSPTPPPAQAARQCPCSTAHLRIDFGLNFRRFTTIHLRVPRLHSFLCCIRFYNDG